MKSFEADVIGQIAKPTFMAGSVDDKETREVSQTDRTSTEETQNNVAKHVEVLYMSEKFRNNFGTSTNRDGVQIGKKIRKKIPLGLQIARYVASVFHLKPTEDHLHRALRSI